MSVKERPILFSGDMVRAILEGRKSQTRRPVKPQPPAIAAHKLDGHTDYKCRYGQPGDQLWVRETFQPLFTDGVDDWRDTDYKTGKGYKVSYPATDGIQEFINLDDEISTACTPSIHMPRWASRITLEITGIRVERLQEISADDAIAEGIERVSDAPYWAWKDYSCHGQLLSPIMSYQTLWDSINAQRGQPWESNPWVWVIDFRRAEQ